MEIQSRLNKPITKPKEALPPETNPWELLTLSIREEIPSDETYKNTIEILKKVISNLLLQPKNQKFRIIRLTNETISKTIGSSISAINFLHRVSLHLTLP
jgi:hypothetical protein